MTLELKPSRWRKKTMIYCASCLISIVPFSCFRAKNITCTSSILSAQETPQRKWTEFHWTRSGLVMQALWLYLPYQLIWAVPNLRVIEKHTLTRLMLGTFQPVGPVPHTTTIYDSLTVQVCLPAPAHINVLLKSDTLESTLLFFMTILSLLIIN